MKKRQNKKFTKTVVNKTADNDYSLVSFGEPESVLSGALTDYLGEFLTHDNGFYIPPIDMGGLAKMKNANPYHGSSIILRRNMLANAYKNNNFFPVGHFRNAQTDVLTFGNAYLRKRYNHLDMPISLEHIPAVNMRVKADGSFILFYFNGSNIEFREDEIIHLKEYDTVQQIYGIPDWMSGLQSSLLNQDATLFRRRYYANGAHLGYIFYSSAAAIEPELKKKFEEKISQSKGVGNFRSMYVHIPNGKEKDIQIIPVGDISQKDEYEKIKKISASDIMVSHRVNCAMLGEKPESNSLYGDLDKITANYINNEVRAMAQIWYDSNSFLPDYMQFDFDFSIPNLIPTENNK